GGIGRADWKLFFLLLAFGIPVGDGSRKGADLQHPEIPILDLRQILEDNREKPFTISEENTTGPPGRQARLSRRPRSRRRPPAEYPATVDDQPTRGRRQHIVQPFDGGVDDLYHPEIPTRRARRVFVGNGIAEAWFAFLAAAFEGALRESLNVHVPRILQGAGPRRLPRSGRQIRPESGLSGQILDTSCLGTRRRLPGGRRRRDLRRTLQVVDDLQGHRREVDVVCRTLVDHGRVGDVELHVVRAGLFPVDL